MGFVRLRARAACRLDCSLGQTSFVCKRRKLIRTSLMRNCVSRPDIVVFGFRRSVRDTVALLCLPVRGRTTSSTEWARNYSMMRRACSRLVLVNSSLLALIFRTVRSAERVCLTSCLFVERWKPIFRAGSTRAASRFSSVTTTLRMSPSIWRDRSRMRRIPVTFRKSAPG